ncbi:hypothetical protein Q2941_25355 [Bradyrhizobium sp. UFLA05-153]
MNEVLAVSRIGAGRSLQRAFTASVLAKIQNTTPERVLKANWSRDEGAQLILRGAVSPSATTGGYPATDVIGAFRSLAPGSAALALLDAGMKLELTGVNTIKVPNLASQPPRFPFVAEGAPSPVVRLNFGQTTLGPTRKVLIISAVTAEIENATPDSASTVIGRVLADSANASIDFVAFDATAGDAVRPPGLLFGVNPIGAAAVGTDAMIDDLAALVAAIGAAGVDPTTVVFVAPPRESTIIKLKAGPKFDYEVFPTLGLPARSVACFAPSAIYSGYQDQPTIETAKDATLHFDDSVPKEIVNSAGVVAAPTESIFQGEKIAIRVRARCAWAVAPGGAQVVNNVNW